MQDFLLLLLFLVLLFWGSIRVNPNANTHISTDYSNLLKGLMAILILFHHIEQELSDGVVFYRIGYICVDVFLFLSGYGLVLSYTKKHRYLKKIITQKIPIIILWSGVSVLGMIAFGGLTNTRFGVKDILGIFVGNDLLNWYFPACVASYLLFVFACKIKYSKIEIRVSFIFIIATIISYLLCHFGVLKIQWVYSLLAFPAGIIYYANEEKIDLWVRTKVFKNKLVFLFVVGLWLSMFVFVNYYLRILNGSLFSLLYLIGIWITGGTLTLLVIVGFKRFTSGAIIQYIGKHSGEMLLVELLALRVLRNNRFNVQNDVLYILGTICIQIVLLLCAIPIMNTIKNKITNWSISCNK